jgi:tetratricopeptide (TPR) repeat protein
MAASIVDEFFTRVSDSKEMKAHGAEQLRAQLLSQAADAYEKLVREDDADSTMQADRGWALGRLGSMYEFLGRSDAAVKCYEQAQEVFRELAVAHPSVRAYPIGMVQSYASLGSLYQETMRRLDLAEQAYRQALLIHRQVAQDHPEVKQILRYQERLIEYLFALSRICLDTSRGAEAGKHCEEARALLMGMAQQSAEEPEYQQSLARGFLNLASLYHRGKCTELAEDAYQQAVSIRERLATRHPDDASNLNSLAWVLDSITTATM